MMDPIILYYGKGQLTGFLVDPNGVLDVVSILDSLSCMHIGVRTRDLSVLEMAPVPMSAFAYAYEFLFLSFLT